MKESEEYVDTLDCLGGKEKHQRCNVLQKGGKLKKSKPPYFTPLKKNKRNLITQSRVVALLNVRLGAGRCKPDSITELIYAAKE